MSTYTPQPWTRLIRFTATESRGLKIHIGQPCNPAQDVGLALLHHEPVKAFEISGTSALDAHAYVTQRVLTVETLLAPVDAGQVGVARFLGLNYTDSALVLVISRQARDVPPSRALDYVLGYTGGNDVSFRMHQAAVPQFGFSKGFDGSAPWGPVLVRAGAIGDPQNLGLRTTLNGEVMQDGNTRNMIFSVAESISFLSQGTTLQPGSLLWTGTPAGCGFARNPQVVLKHGDEVRVWVGGGVGTLVNSVEEEGREREGERERARL
ncbi:hypothetical protein DACRYDRAFT_92353 [Dacryopinax primogenitus]|uniref:Fumarylacetoacetase-like C-terminal domain-containing protein n=1 Tax=Dacryopinax primogenitus (strain DJM 731) TaxID=1858805 RepID=M5GCL4_DACPD|nr:uncharacterized protein DACRYDRAFT_92353 [Dacryopinax primogenitus]EJU06285.1 hypothetical protein DACRYDRAFT_92353 [Dacryopinax primogenitus]